jgi:ParB family chromosome partitioning protein
MTIDARRTQGGLGRGLASLIPTGPGPQAPATIPLAAIRRNPFQPRRTFDDDQMRQLTDSVAQHGVLQPVLVTEIAGGYQLIAGERRLRAAQLAGLSVIPAVVRSADEQSQLAMALVENLQRADLNAMDAAAAFRQLMTEFGLTQEEVALRVGRSRPAIANTLRLLALAPDLQAAVSEGRISEGHARAMAGLDDHAAQVGALALVESGALSVRQTEQLVRRLVSAPAPGTASPSGSAEGDPDLERMATRLRESLGTRVTLAATSKGGRMTITWFDDDDLARLYQRLTGEDR